MISAPNHPQRSSGSRIVWLLFVAILLGSCGPFRSAVDEGEVELEEVLDPSQLVFNPITKRLEKANPRLVRPDSVRWTVIESDPITTAEIVSRLTLRPYSEKKESYLLSMLLPLNADRLMAMLDRELITDTRFLQFYLGFKMGARELSEAGLQLELDVYDLSPTGSSVNELIRNGSLDDSDMIIGPYHKEDLERMAEFAAEREIPLVSPWSALKSVTVNNPNYLLLRAGIEEHCKALYEYIRNNYNLDHVTLISRDQNRGIVNFIQDIHLESNPAAHRLNEYIIVDTAITLEETDFDSLLAFEHPNVLFIPEYEPSFVYSLLRTINIARAQDDILERDEREVDVFGLPQWTLFQRIDYDFFEDLNIHVSSSGFLDKSDPDIRFFRKRFAAEHGILPTEDAYEGYDAIKFLATMIHKYGKRFQYYLDQESIQLLHSGFAIKRDLTTDEDSYWPRINCFENTYIEILKFEDFQFKKVGNYAN
jgi:hypothetical protein